mgnify:CR=1 FL=1
MTGREIVIANAKRHANEVTALIEAGKRVPRAMTEDLRNDVRKLIKLIGETTR